MHILISFFIPVLTGQPPLVMACVADGLELVQVLLDHGADGNWLDTEFREDWDKSIPPHLCDVVKYSPSALHALVSWLVMWWCTQILS